MKRLVSFILILCLTAGLLVGCSSDEQSKNTVPMGRYVEQTIAEFADANCIMALHRTSSGETAFYVEYPNGETCRYTRCTVDKDGKLSEEDAPELGGFLSTDKRWAKNISVSDGGEVYLLYGENGGTRVAHLEGGAFRSIEVAELASGGDGDIDYSDIDLADLLGDGVDIDSDISTDEEGNKVGSFSFSGSLDDIDTSTSGSFNFTYGGEGDNELYCTGILAADDGFYLLFGSDGLYRYDQSGRKLAEFPGNAFVSGGCAVRGSTLVLPDESNSGLTSYDLDSMRSTGNYQFDSSSMFISNVGLDESGIYIADSTGIYRQAEGGSILELLVDGSLTSLVMPNFTLSSVISGAEDDFYAAVLDGEDTIRLVRYYLDKTIPTLPDTELTIFSLRDNATVRQAIGEFQRANPSVRVNLRVGMSEGSSVTVEDIVRTLNTEILAGKGPDLLLLDGLPVEDYIEKGVLRDLTSLVDEIKGESNLLENLLGAYSYDGRIYGLASKFTLPIMVGESGALEGLNSLETLVERTKASDGKPFLLAPDDLYTEPGSMINSLLAPLGRNMIADGKLDVDALERYLASSLELDAAMKAYTPENDGFSDTVYALVTMGGAGLGSETMDNSSMEIAAGKARMYISTLIGVNSLLFTASNLEGSGEMELASLFHMDMYTPLGAVGMLSGSKQAELAESFIQLLMSRKVQDVYLYDGFSVNADSFDAILDRTLNGEQVLFNTKDDFGFSELARRLSTPIRSDAVLADAVAEVAASVANGGTTPSDAARSIADSLRLYLAE